MRDTAQLSGDTILLLRADARCLPLPDESVHLVVTSPPYNAGVAYDGFDDWLPWQEYWDGLLLPALRECFRVLVTGGRLCLNMANMVRSDVGQGTWIRDGYDGRGRARKRRYRASGAGGKHWGVMVAARLWPALEQIGFLPREHLTWLKADDPTAFGTGSTSWGTFCSARNPVLRAVAEPVFIVSKGSHARESGMSDLTSEEFKAWSRNCWVIRSDRKAAPWHPAEFPLELVFRLIKLYSYRGDSILDPFSGSGTTVMAASMLGRRGVGVDLSERYCSLARERCRQGFFRWDVASETR
jgi:DNA modification methylase